MSDVVVTVEDPEGAPTAEEAAVAAAAMEGATAVHAEQAAEAAQEAKDAAGQAQSAALANLESSAEAVEAGESAQAAARDAAITAEMLHEALKAQSAAINALVEELRSTRKQSVPSETKSKKPDREPSPGGTRLVRS